MTVFAGPLIWSRLDAIHKRIFDTPFEDTSMKKSLLLASLIASIALAACGKKEEPVAEAPSEAASAPAEVASEVAPVASEAASEVAPAVEAASEVAPAASN